MHKQASLLAATSHATKVSELKQRLERTENEVEALRKALGEAEEKAVQQQAARKKLKARVKEVQQELQDAVKKCETLENDASAQEAELTKARQGMETTRNEAQA